MRGRAGWLLALAVLALGTILLKRSRVPGGSDAQLAAGPRADPRIQVFWDLYRRASQSRTAGQLEEAIRLYDDALLLRPKHEDALYYRANCAFDLGRDEDAIRTYERLVDANPLASSRGYMQLGIVHGSIARGAPLDLVRARREFQRALEIDQDSGAVLSLGEVALLAADWKEAEAHLRAADAGDPMSVAAPYLLGFIAWREHDSARAWREFRRAVARGEVKKPAVKWTEEGDLKADPALRWKALARQTITGEHWLRIRRYLAPPGPTRHHMEVEYRRFQSALEMANRPKRAG